MQPRQGTRHLGPVTVLVALLFVAAAALRGYVPGAVREPRPAGTESPWSTIVVGGLLVAAVAVVVVAVVVRLLTSGERAPKTAARSDWLRGESARPTRRTWLIALCVVCGWLLVFVVLSRLGGGGRAPASSSTSLEAPVSSLDAGGAGADPPIPSHATAHLLDYFFGATVIFVLAVVIGTVVAARRRRRPPASVAAPFDDESSPSDDVGPQSLARAAEVALAEVGDLSREPRKAIIACYVAMEGELSLLPDSAPRDFDTASEVLARAVDSHALRPDSATQLVDLFDEARFSPHVMTEEHRDAAVAALTRVLGELRSHV